jgi:hypothetical protein
MNPTEIDKNAPVIARHSLLVEAPIEKIWRLHTDINGWRSWQGSIDAAAMHGPFQVGATFTWRTFNLDISSTIYQVKPMRHTLWGGPSEGIVGIHSWTFTNQGDAVLVATEESWSGQAVEDQAPDLQTALDGSLIAWLKFLAEAAQA